MLRWFPVFIVGCAPVLDDLTPYVTEPRVLAVRAEPAEVEAGAEVHLVSLVADADGELTEAALDWSFCTVPKPLAELGPVAPTCLRPDSPFLAPIGSGLDAAGLVPDDACSLFGPNPPPPRAGQPGGRPADPDVTGGYYQPAVGFLDGDGAEATLVSVRLRCGIANVSQETYIAWNQAYVSNSNPAVEALAADGAPLTADGDAPVVSPGQDVALEVAWPECPDEPGACGGAETYVVYDADADELRPRREPVSATWFATGGRFADARNGRGADDAATTLDNTWTAPDEPGRAWIAVALRDDRGGVAFAGGWVEVR